LLTRPLGQTGARVSEVGFGCASWWGRPAFDERTAVGLVHQALEGGVTFFDTGASYSKGGAEARLGRALAGRDLDGVIVATKAGTDFNDGVVVRDFSPGGVEASIERSRQRLGLDTIPLLQLHGPAAPELDAALLDRLAALRERGWFRWLGLNSFDAEVLAWAVEAPALDAVMLDYNVLRPERAALIARAAENGKAVLAGMPLAMGHVGLKVLKPRAPRDFWYAARGLVRHRREVRDGARFRFLGDAPGWSAAQAALAYVLANDGVSCAVVGTTRQGHLREALAVSGRRLPAEVMDRIADVQCRLASAPRV
jgi:aryl-alcohol dehydrogenase-like predicted oxidoreductase